MIPAELVPVLVLNGPNLGRLGRREPGTGSYRLAPHALAEAVRC